MFGASALPRRNCTTKIYYYVKFKTMRLCMVKTRNQFTVIGKFKTVFSRVRSTRAQPSFEFTQVKTRVSNVFTLTLVACFYHSKYTRFCRLYVFI